MCCISKQTTPTLHQLLQQRVVNGDRVICGLRDEVFVSSQSDSLSSLFNKCELVEPQMQRTATYRWNSALLLPIPKNLEPWKVENDVLKGLNDILESYSEDEINQLRSGMSVPLGNKTNQVIDIMNKSDLQSFSQTVAVDGDAELLLSSKPLLQIFDSSGRSLVALNIHGCPSSDELLNRISSLAPKIEESVRLPQELKSMAQKTHLSIPGSSGSLVKVRLVDLIEPLNLKLNGILNTDARLSSSILLLGNVENSLSGDSILELIADGMGCYWRQVGHSWHLACSPGNPYVESSRLIIEEGRRNAFLFNKIWNAGEKFSSLSLFGKVLRDIDMTSDDKGLIDSIYSECLAPDARSVFDRLIGEYGLSGLQFGVAQSISYDVKTSNGNKFGSFVTIR